ncbi:MULTISPECIES: hypothetical protein [unclassified Allomuricauda]|uniref:hypothetical protein n=1 Tax=unclassified Allomuricauda TaxID=2615049 RepID=UPI00273D1308|nr:MULTISPECIES: hypothetical protein [unclassified Allomuricauda]
MRNTLLFLTALLFLSCSSNSEEDESSNKTFDLSIDLERSVYGVDERITINAFASVEMSAGCIKSASFYESSSPVRTCLLTDVGKSFQLNFSFQEGGTKTFVIEGQTSDGKISTLERQIEIDSTTNTVRISKITLNSFPNIGKAWDETESDTDPERLADLYFQINKRSIDLTVGDNAPEYKFIDLSFSEIHENESSLVWEFNDKELLFSKDNFLYFKLFEFDGEQGSNEEFANTLITMSDYANQKPNQINIVEGLLDITMDVEWY